MMLSDEPTSCKSRGLGGLDDNLVPQRGAIVWLKSQVSAIINFSRAFLLQNPNHSMISQKILTFSLV